MALKEEQRITEPDVYDDGCLRVEYNKYYAACDDKPLYNLTAKEFLILSRLVREIGRPVSQPEIWASVWGENEVFDHEASNLLRVHLSTLRRKLSVFGVHILNRPNVGYTLTTMDCVCPTQNQNTPGDQ
jgi:DNA-binding response OmpR family regulator